MPYHDENGQPYWITSEGQRSPADPEVTFVRAFWQTDTHLLLWLVTIQLLLASAYACAEHLRLANEGEEIGRVGRVGLV